MSPVNSPNVLNLVEALVDFTQFADIMQDIPHLAPGSPLLQQLESISSPVPNLAATLTTQGDPEPAAENMSYLRTRLPESHLITTMPREQDSRRSYLTEDEFRRFSSESRRRMLRNFDHPRRAVESIAPNSESIDASNYTDRTPIQQSLYDWAPSLQRGEDDEDFLTPRPTSFLDSSDPLPSLEQSQLAGLRALRSREAVRRRYQGEVDRFPTPHWSELRNSYANSSATTTALLQSVERHRRYNARARSSMQDFILDRGNNISSPTTPSSPAEPINNYSRLHRSEIGLDSTSHHRSDLRAAYRMVQEDPTLSKQKNVIKYLSQLRKLSSVEDALEMAEDLGIDTLLSSGRGEPMSASDLLLSLDDFPFPAQSSWLEPGTTFCGSQHSAPGSSARLIHSAARNNPQLTTENVPASLLSLINAEEYVSSISAARSGARTGAVPTVLSDRWPVKVVIDSVDYKTMTLTGTMSASHIPDKLSPTSPDHKPHGSSMESFFEGEIIDFKFHALETDHYRSDGIETDVTYWRQLGPLREISARNVEHGDEDILRCLSSHKWLQESLMQEWILMRWKEKCFIRESDAGWGLTISGFYYITLRRSTGQIEGLYYDPGSHPYQQLSLVPEGTYSDNPGRKIMFPAMQFA